MKPIILAILDGFGYRENIKGNAIKNAKTPNINYFMDNYPHSLLDASEESVGLPKGQMGNSEVGHLNIGAGRIVYQPLTLIDKKISEGDLYKNNLVLEIINHVKKNGSKLHLMGLVSDGGVHSHINHLFSLLDMCKKENIENVYIHVITDGRDTLPNISLNYIRMLEEKINSIGIGKIASISGRFYAMDRDNRWDRIKKYYDCIVYGDPNEKISIHNYVENSFHKNIYDEFIEPCLLEENGLVEENDGLIFFNFRSDRANQILMSFANKDFDKFEHNEFKNLMVISMMPVANYVNTRSIFQLQNINNTFGEYISNLGYSQLRIAETEKYNHVTYFFDGNKNVDFKKENKMSSYRNKSILLCIITFLIGFMFLDFGKRDNSKEVENMKFSLESVEAQVYKKESEKSSLESQIENLKKNISNLESESSNLQNRLEELKNTKIQ